MAVIYSEFDTTPSTAAADIKTKVLTSSDWASLTGAGLTSAVKATTPRGAQMVVDFADAAATAIRLQLGVYRTHDGTTGVDKINRFISTRDSGGATSDIWHCVVSAGPQHLYVSVEGPRTGETNANLSTAGSHKQSLYIGDLTPYFGGDTVPAVVLAGLTSATATPAVDYVYVSRNAADTASWVPAYACTVAPLGTTTSVNGVRTQTSVATGDSNEYIWPWVIVEQSAGLRGRLTNAFYGGHTLSVTGDQGLSLGSRVTYSSQNYVAQVPHYYRSGNGNGSYGPWWHAGSGTNNQSDGPLLMVPCT